MGVSKQDRETGKGMRMKHLDSIAQITANIGNAFPDIPIRTRRLLARYLASDSTLDIASEGHFIQALFESRDQDALRYADLNNLVAFDSIIEVRNAKLGLV